MCLTPKRSVLLALCFVAVPWAVSAGGEGPAFLVKDLNQASAGSSPHSFAVFNGQVDGETPPELTLHLIVDKYGLHKHPRVKSWLRRHPRFHLHFIPTSSSWLNPVERWFREITDQRLRRGSFENVAALIKAITDYLDHHN